MAIIKRIHINQQIIRRNRKTGKRDACITIKARGRSIYAQNVDIMGESEVIYSPDKPLDCGAQVWVETKAPVWYLPPDSKSMVLLAEKGESDHV